MIFFEIKLLLQPDVVFDSESNGCNLSSLAPPGGEKKIIFNFFLQNENNFFSPESLNYNHSTQNRKLHQIVVTNCFRKKTPLTVNFHSTIINLILILILIYLKSNLNLSTQL